MRKTKVNLLVVAFLLVFLVGPSFGPLLGYLAFNQMDRVSTLWLNGAFLVTGGIVFAVMCWLMKKESLTFGDLGWGRPTTKKALVSGAIFGVVWGIFGIMGFLQSNPGINIFQFDLFRLAVIVMGIVIATGEDVITRGYVMSQLQRLGAGQWLQVLGSAILFGLYHSIWGFSVFGFVGSLVYGLILSGLFLLGKHSLTPVILSHALTFAIGEPFLTMSIFGFVRGGV